MPSLYCPRCERAEAAILSTSARWRGLSDCHLRDFTAQANSRLKGSAKVFELEARPFGVHVVLVEPGDFQSEINAKRRIFTSKESAYQTAFEKLLQRRARDETSAPTPEAVAQLIELILNCSRPKTRYAIGMLRQRILVPAKRFLPQHMFEWLFRRAMGL